MSLFAIQVQNEDDKTWDWEFEVPGDFLSPFYANKVGGVVGFYFDVQKDAMDFMPRLVELYPHLQFRVVGLRLYNIGVVSCEHKTSTVTTAGLICDDCGDKRPMFDEE